LSSKVATVREQQEALVRGQGAWRGQGVGYVRGEGSSFDALAPGRRGKAQAPGAKNGFPPAAALMAAETEA
jgi:hypothetical protein